MKKRSLLLILLVWAAGTLQAQTFEEWFNQKQTQKKYLLQQIAALQVYIGYARKGYNIAREGLNTIGGFTRGEWNLHTGYMQSLKQVNPEIKRYVRVADIMRFQLKILQDQNRARRQLSSSGAFSNDELAYIGRVFSRLLDDCSKTLDELVMITTDGKLEMKDDERMARIDKLCQDMQDKFTFSQRFSNDARSLAASRLKEKTDVQTSRVWHGIINE